MLLLTLGTAAGGGVPQWNCACPGCSGARAHPDRRRRHDSLAVFGEDRSSWFLVNSGPDITEQLETHAALRPGTGSERTPVVRILLTDAELDHTLGLLRLREAHHLEIYATAPVRQALRERLALDTVLTPYTAVTWHDLPPAGQTPAVAAGIEVSAVPLSTKRPRYAADAAEDDAWVVAARLHDPASGATALYAPALAAWTEGFAKEAAGADCVFVDGTFWDEEEPRRLAISARTSTGMGHLPIDGPGGTAGRLSQLPARCLYTHFNNTNPLVDPIAPQHGVLAGLGLEVAQDGMVIEL
ncbi:MULTISPECIES: pyrroloquinoline quinone biosynthesis protein PqqB [Streptomyces]|uniref:Coenzyme PQQ synthesis protein B n=1 Tax=Streptomyces poriferorum TaxID=2798799 RepID=A0ABY9IKU2_9ACTN|nr:MULTISPECIES: MBL fold metallo-hydrolase [unclassified Streptomyces]MDP5316960.1 MBL fold metallo-hydrolase [Streptomyces sp. Alt4]WLQ55241.1 MBL fold metallo-hydrolase [Streptomyces sp. Alt2]WSI66876.1 MBL fold metallo-hydrolase [Streptomyces sp. NBC_01336]